MEPRGDARRPVPARPVAVPRGHRATSPGPDSTWRSSTCAARAPASRSTACSAACAARGRLLLLPRPRRATTTSPRSARAGVARRLRELLPQGRHRSRGRGLRDGRHHPRGDRARRRGCGSTPTARWCVPEALRMLGAHGGARHRLRRAARPRPSGRPAGRAARAAPMAVCANEGLWSEADTCAAHPQPRQPTCLLQPLLGRLARRFHATVARRAPRGPAGLQAHARRARARRRRRAAPAADAAEHRRGAPADGADDGGRRRSTAPLPIADGADVGRARGRGPRRRGRRGAAARGAPAATRSTASSCPTSRSSWAARAAPNRWPMESWLNRRCCRPGRERLWSRGGRGTAAHPRAGRRYAPGGSRRDRAA